MYVYGMDGTMSMLLATYGLCVFFGVEKIYTDCLKAEENFVQCLFYFLN